MLIRCSSIAPDTRAGVQRKRAVLLLRPALERRHREREESLSAPLVPNPIARGHPPHMHVELRIRRQIKRLAERKVDREPAQHIFRAPNRIRVDGERDVVVQVCFEIACKTVAGAGLRDVEGVFGGTDVVAVRCGEASLVIDKRCHGGGAVLECPAFLDLLGVESASS